MTFAIVYVFPEPVTPSKVWYDSPFWMPSVSVLIASGWSPAGSKIWCSRNRLSGNVTIRGAAAVAAAVFNAVTVMEIWKLS